MIAILTLSWLRLSVTKCDMDIVLFSFPYTIIYLHLYNIYIIIYIYMVGGIPTPLKNMSSSVGMMTFPTEWQVIKVMFQTNNQYVG